MVPLVAPGPGAGQELLRAAAPAGSEAPASHKGDACAPKNRGCCMLQVTLLLTVAGYKQGVFERCLTLALMLHTLFQASAAAAGW